MSSKDEITWSAASLRPSAPSASSSKRMVHQQEPKTLERTAVLGRQIHQLVLGEQEVLGVRIVSAEPRGVHPENMGRYGKLQETR